MCTPLAHRTLALATSLLLVLACQPPDDPGEAPGQPAFGARQDAFRIGNSLSTRALVSNALLTHPEAVFRLSLSPLDSNTFATDDVLRLQLRDPYARVVMQYLVGCALASSQAISWTDPFDGYAYGPWRGEASLCPEWHTGAPTPECLERVSACLLARNNAMGRKVPLSMRGENASWGTPFPLDLSVNVGTTFPTGAGIASFAACGYPTPGVTRNCSWSPVKVGACTPGSTVRVGGGGVPPDRCGWGAPLGSMVSGDMVFRVCRGIRGCDNGSGDLLAQSEGSCGTILPAVTFTCPGSGTFSVMVAPYWSDSYGEVKIKAEDVGGNRYPASEQQVFRIREGAFYGTLFDPDAIAFTVRVNQSGQVEGQQTVVQGAVYKRMYSCWDGEWDYGRANQTQRYCAYSYEQNCAATPVGICDRNDPWGTPARCEVNDGTLRYGDGDLQRCRDSSDLLWMHPITTYLHEACDLVGSPNNPKPCLR